MVMNWPIDQVRIGIYSSIFCVHRNINAPAKPLKFIARASHHWSNDAEFGKRFDHVMIQTHEEGRLQGCRLARIRLIGKLLFEDQSQDIMCVQWYDPHEYLENIRMQSYRLSSQASEVISTINLVRNVHVVPIWESMIEEQLEPVLNPDIYQRYSEFVINTQSDQASWNYFY